MAQLPRVTVGRQSAGFLSRGHPWLRRDRFTRGWEQLASGDAVTLADEQGRAIASALIDREHPTILARVYHRQGDRPFILGAALQRAVERRGHLAAEGTDAYRVVHGEADFLPGLRCERLADWLLVTVRAACIAPYAEEAALWLADAYGIPHHQVVIRDHLDDERRQRSSARMLDGSPLPSDSDVMAHEFAVPVHCQPAARLASGVYVDQRGTRAWLRERCQGWHILNLFAYSGLFSTSCLAAGAAQATSVDLSAPALALAERNGLAAGVADRQRIVKADCRAFCEDDSGSYDCIICDPPTAAQGAGGWLVRRDYPLLLTALKPRLRKGGILIACANTLGKPYGLAEAVSAAGLRVHAAAQGPQLGADIPQLSGFAEGRPYRLVVAGLE